MAVLYMNGEPLLYRDLCKAISYASERGIATMIATNAILLNENKISEILKAGVDFIKVAISGNTQETYGIQVRRGDVAKVKENIRLLDQMNRAGHYHAFILIDYILYDYNKHELEPIRQFCKELDVMLSIRPGSRKGVEDIEPPRPPTPLPLATPCDWPWKVLSINWNCDIMPCCDFPLWSNGWVYGRFEPGSTDILKVWNGESTRNMRKIHATQGRAPIPVCAVCDRRGTAFKY
jgi:MoaA/NifB/PqqE/SkfB family radical SAM enzyme